MAMSRTDKSERAVKRDKIGGFCSLLGRAKGKEGGEHKEKQLDLKNTQEAKTERIWDGPNMEGQEEGGVQDYLDILAWAVRCTVMPATRWRIPQKSKGIREWEAGTCDYNSKPARCGAPVSIKKLHVCVWDPEARSGCKIQGSSPVLPLVISPVNVVATTDFNANIITGKEQAVFREMYF